MTGATLENNHFQRTRWLRLFIPDCSSRKTKRSAVIFVHGGLLQNAHKWCEQLVISANKFRFILTDHRLLYRDRYGTIGQCWYGAIGRTGMLSLQGRTRSQRTSRRASGCRKYNIIRTRRHLWWRYGGLVVNGFSFRIVNDTRSCVCCR